MEFEWASDIEPTGLNWEDDHNTVAIQWSDGHATRYSVSYLRAICPCAVCRDAHASPPLTAAPQKSFTILTDVQATLAKHEHRALEAYPIGAYAVGFRWSDGHDEGIYSWRYLRGMCPCEQCDTLRTAQV